MTLKVVQDTSTNWTNAEWRIIDRMKKNYAEMDERSGRPWRLGDDLLILDPPGDDGINSGRVQRIADAALEIGCAAGTLRKYGQTSVAWPGGGRPPGVAYSVFYTLNGADDRVKILKALVAEYGPEGITVDAARRAMDIAPTRPHGLKEFVADWSSKLDRFMDQRLYSADRLALEQLRLKIDILLGDAEEEAI